MAVGVVTPPVVNPNNIPGIVTTPTTGQTYNPVTPERLAQIAANWQTMGEPARQAATRNQAAAIAAANRARDRAEQAAAMNATRLQGIRDRRAEQLALQRRQEAEYTRNRRDFNRDITNRQQVRLNAAAALRTQRAERLAIQRANEKQAVAKAKSDKAAKDAILARNRRITQTNAANEARTKATSWRNAVKAGKTTGAAQAQQYFKDQGADFAPYSGSVDQAIRQIAATLNPNETPAANTFANVGQDVYNRMLNQGRTRAQSALQPHFGTGFEQRLLPNTATDATIKSIQQEQFGEAQQYIDNLLNRGVITQPGYDKAFQNLQGQQGQVNLQLQDIGKDILAGGQQDLTDIGNTAGLAAGNLSLGAKFNTAPYLNQTAQAIQKFNQNLPAAFKTQIQGPLFDTTNLANIAGKVTQGGQNTKFEPYSLAGTAPPKQPLFEDTTGMKSVF